MVNYKLLCVCGLEQVRYGTYEYFNLEDSILLLEGMVNYKLLCVCGLEQVRYGTYEYFNLDSVF